MPYNPYNPRTNGRPRNPKAAAITGCPALPLYDAGSAALPSLVITNFSLAGGSGSSATVTWHLLNGGDGNTSYVVYLFGGANPQPVYPRDVDNFPAGLATTFTSSITLTANWYYFFLIVATNSAGVNEAVSATLQYGPPFNPAGLTAPLVTWFKGDSGLTSTTWTNNGTNGGSATFTGPTTSQTVNGLSAVSFKPNVGYATYTTNFTGQPRAFFWVIKFNAALTSTPIPLAGSTYGGDPFIQLYTSGAQQYMVLASFGGSTSITTDVFSANQTSLAAVFGEFASASAANNLAYYNSTSLTLTGSNAASGYSTGSRTGYLNAFANPSIVPNTQSITYCEVLGYDGELTSTDVLNVVNYLRTKWGTS